MNDRYKRRLSVLLFSLISFTISAQDINDIGAAKVNQMKIDGKLTGKEQFTNRAASPSVMRVTGASNSSQSSAICNCWIPQDTSFHIAQFDYMGGSGGPGLPPDYRNDDWSMAPITLPFNICFYGTNVNQVFINNNGNVSIGAPYSTFTANSFPDPSYVMIAPFWADVDTRGPLSGIVYYSLDATHLIVQWQNVGYFPSQDDKLNSFQLIVTNGSDPIIPIGQNVSFCYKDMQWTTGSASGGVGGFGGTPATVGVNQGNGIDYIQFGLFDQTGTNYDGAYGLNDGVDWLDNQSFNLNACISSSNIPPVLNSLNVCDTIHLCENTTYQLTANYLSPEQGEITNINYFLGTMTGITVLSNTPGNSAAIVLEIVGQTSNLGYHTISVTALDNGSPPAATNNNFVIEVLPAPLPSFTFAPASPVQINTPVTFTNTTAPGSLITWDFGDGSPTSTFANPQHTYTTPGTYTITLSAMFPNGCVAIDTQQIVITSCVPATFTVNDVCVNSASLISLTSIFGPTAVFTWGFNGGNILSGSGGGPYDISWNTPGQFTISLTVTENICTSTVSMPINVFAIPVSSVSPLPQLCAGDSPNVSFNGTSGAGATYTWNFGSATVISGSGSGPYNLQWNTAITDQISLIVSENGCSDTSQITVQVYPIPTATFNTPAAGCANDLLNIVYTGTASAAANYTWNFNGGNILSGSGQGPYTISWNTGGNYSVDLSVTENGCISPPVNIPVDITSIPVVSISPVPAMCAGATNNVSFTGTTGVNAVYNWSFGNATLISGNGPGPYSLQWNTVGNDQITLSVDENGCVSQSFIDITVYPIPTSDFVINNAACINQPVTLNYTGSATVAANYNWSFSGGTIISGSNAGPYSVVWNTQGLYQLSLVVTENGCVSPQTDLMATVNPLPFVFAGNDQLVCSGIPVQLGNAAVAGEAYLWTPALNLSDPIISNPVATPVNNSVATIEDSYILTVTDANGCVNTDSVLVGSYPVPVVRFNKPASQCIKNNNFLFAASANILSGVNYSWTFSPEADLASSTQTNVNIVYSTTGTFPVYLTGDYNGCPAQQFIDSVTIFEMPVSDFFPQVLDGCVPLRVPFTNISAGNGNIYNWNFGDGTNDNEDNAIHVYQHSGIYTVSLSAVNENGCLADTTFNDIINVYALPVGQFIPNPQLANILAPIIQFQNYSTNVLSYSWEFGDGDTSTAWSPDHTYLDTGNYDVTLMLMSAHGCVDTVRGLVRVEDNFSFYVPNSFTPNGDGINDAFRGYGIAIRNYLMNIYNRWGELIFTTDNYDKSWDGSLKTGVVQNDVYVYRIALTDQHDEKHVYVGNVSVVK